ncbi:MAG: ECF transporter S component [Clostridia bacterium]|nr:ECF transporter S component [Clostridia bacterium]
MEEEQNEEERQESVPEEQTEPVLQEEPKEEKTTRGERVKAILREHFSAPRLAYMALFTALAYVVTFLEFPIFPATPFLKLDFSNVFFLIEGFIFGPVEAIVSIGIKECLSLIDTQTAGVGELANFLMSTAFIIVPAIGYRFLKGRKWVAVFLVAACAVQISVSALVNRYINYPFYGSLFGFDGAAMFNSTWEFVIAFNAIKSVSISVLVFLVYKPLSKFIKATDLRFQKRMQKVKEKRKER